MSYAWIAERVAVADIEVVLRNVILGEEKSSWGPNNVFRYPLRGGTGFLCEALRAFVADKLHPVAVDPVGKEVRTSDGRRWPYDVLLSTMPLNRLVETLESVPDAVRRAAGDLRWCGGHIVGVGLDRPANSAKNWAYFPEPHVPFYRVTYLSNYSPCMTPGPGQTLLLTETSRSPYKPEDDATIVERVIDGLVAARLMEEDERDLVVTAWSYSPEMTYPVPSVTRDRLLGVIQPWLRSQDILSRGRFGAWLYEIGNMDHSTMQGVDFVDHVLFGQPETVWIPRGEAGAPP